MQCALGVTGTMWNLGAVHPQIGSEDTCDLIRCDKGIPFCGKSHLPSACVPAYHDRPVSDAFLSALHAVCS